MSTKQILPPAEPDAIEGGDLVDEAVSRIPARKEGPNAEPGAPDNDGYGPPRRMKAKGT